MNVINIQYTIRLESILERGGEREGRKAVLEMKFIEVGSEGVRNGGREERAQLPGLMSSIEEEQDSS